MSDDSPRPAPRPGNAGSEDPTAEHGPSTRGPLARGAWASLGFALTAMGALGLLLPGLPATGFFVAAAACFSRSSTRIERWLLSMPIVGKLVDDYRSGRGMPVRAKAVSVCLIAVFSTFAVVRVDPVALEWIIAVAGITGIAVVAFYVPTWRD